MSIEQNNGKPEFDATHQGEVLPRILGEQHPNHSDQHRFNLVGARRVDIEVTYSYLFPDPDERKEQLANLARNIFQATPIPDIQEPSKIDLEISDEIADYTRHLHRVYLDRNSATLTDLENLLPEDRRNEWMFALFGKMLDEHLYGVDAIREVKFSVPKRKTSSGLDSSSTPETVDEGRINQNEGN